MAGPDPGPGLAPGLSLAPVEPATIPHAGHWVPTLPWDALRPSGFAASGSAAAASRNSGPHLFEGLCALVTPDSLNVIAVDQRVACLCQSALLLPLDSAHCQSVAADRRFRRHSADSDLLPRAGAPWPPPAGQPSALLLRKEQVLTETDAGP